MSSQLPRTPLSGTDTLCGSTSSAQGERLPTTSFAAFNHGGLPLPARTHTSNRYGHRPPPPSQNGRWTFLPLLDLPAVNVGLIESPTTAPDNTPVPSTGASDRTPPGLRLPTIDEVLQRLPELPDDVSSPATTLADAGFDDGAIPHSSPILPSSPIVDSRSPSPLSQDGVREHTDWQEDIEGDLDRALARLANLARDDHEQDRSLSAEQHYTRRLDAAIERQRTRYLYLQQAKSTLTSVMIQRAKLRSLLETITARVLVPEAHGDAMAAVAELLNEIDQQEVVQ